MARTPSDQYWQRRMAAQQAYLLEEGEVLADYVQQQYQQAAASIQKEIDAWYGRYAKNNQITYTEAKRHLSTREREELRWTVEEYIKKGRENAIRGQWLKELENASAKVHVTRLESLKIQMQQQAELLFGNQLDGMDRTMRNILTEGYRRTAFEIQRGVGVGWRMDGLDPKRMDLLMKKPWAPDGRNFSERVWDNRELLVSKLETHLTQGLIRGDSPDKMIATIQKEMGVSKSAASRLVMTESAYFASVGKHESLKALGVNQYKIVAALDSRTSELCQDLDGMVFDLGDYQVGRTAPPFHPNCRTTFTAYFEDNIGERAARNQEGKTYYIPSDMKYHEWKKTQESGIMDTGSDAANMKPIIITAETVAKIKTPSVDIWPKAMNDRLNLEHQGLLQLAMEHLAGVEVAVRYGEQFSGKVVSVGGIGNVKIDLTSGRIYIHNHPSGNTFTLDDVEQMLFHDNIEVLTAVGNNGAVYLLYKNEQYNFTGIYRRFQDALKSAPNYEESPESYISFMEKLLSSLEEYGLVYRKAR